MRNFGSVRAVIAERDVQTNRLGVASSIVVRAAPVRLDGLACQNVSSRSFRPRSGDANDSLLNSAGLILMGYSDTAGAPSADLRR